MPVAVVLGIFPMTHRRVVFGIMSFKDDVGDDIFTSYSTNRHIWTNSVKCMFFIMFDVKEKNFVVIKEQLFAIFIIISLTRSK